jgi:anti-sigma factor RsiW
MKCRHVHEALFPYLDGALAATEREALERHVGACAGCRAELERTKALMERLDAARVEPPLDVDGAWLAFQERLREVEPARSPTAWWRRWWLLPVPVAAAAAVALVVAWGGRSGGVGLPDELELVQNLDLLESLDCVQELSTLEASGLFGDPAEIERALEEVGG